MMMAITAPAGDWVKAGSYQIPMPATAQGADGRPHLWVALYKPDISLLLAWGASSGQDPDYPFTFPWPAAHAREHQFADIVWNGVPVARRGIWLVDNDRCYLPDASPAHAGTAEEAAEGRCEQAGLAASESDIALARLLQGLAHPTGPRFGAYLRDSGIVAERG